jgi:hypothetical protein
MCSIEHAATAGGAADEPTERSMADKQPTKKTPKKNKKHKTGAQPDMEETSTALVASHPPDPETAAVDQLERTLGTITANQATLGELTLSYPARDVVLVLDGLTAARVIAAFADPARRTRLQDQLDTATSSMRNLWASFDLDQLLAVSWMPHLPTRATSRMTVDPPNPHAASETGEPAAAVAGD